MNGKEFRLGNMIYYKVGLWGGGIDKRKCFLAKITGLYGEGAFSFQALEGKIPDAHIFEEPIPLTEEWLLRFGFEKDRSGYRLDDINSLSFSENYIVCWHDKVLGIKQIEYVHQLQNLYFTLTGEELTIKDIKK